MKGARLFMVAILSATALLATAFAPASATHAWGPYHWARTSNPFTLKVVNSVTSGWDSYLATAQSDWAKSTVLDLSSLQGDETSTSRRQCNPISGRVRVCNQTYGFNGWLGVANIWITTGNHIAQGTTKLNDSYFNTSTYNKPEWRQMVTCQEIGHDWGLAHQDENFNNANLGTCMDYTNNPLGPPDNTHPNSHDYAQLVTIYGHTDSFNSFSMALPVSTGPATGLSSSVVVNLDDNGVGTITFILWADPQVTAQLISENPFGITGE